MRNNICLGLGAALAFAVSVYAQEYKINKVGSEEEQSFDVLLNQVAVTQAAAGSWIDVTPIIPSGKVFKGFTVYDEYGMFPNQQRVSATTKDETHFLMPDHDVYVKASFESLRYMLSVSSTDNGSVTLSFNDRYKDRTKPGTKVTVNPQANDGYKVDAVKVSKQDDANTSVNCVTEPEATDGRCSFDMPYFNVVVSAQFVSKTLSSSSSEEVVSSSSENVVSSSSAETLSSSSSEVVVSSSSVVVSSSSETQESSSSSAVVSSSSETAVSSSSVESSSSAKNESSSSEKASSSSVKSESSSSEKSSSSVRSESSSSEKASSSSTKSESSSSVKASSSSAKSESSSSVKASSSSTKSASSSSVKVSSSSTKSASSSSVKASSSSTKATSSSSVKASSSSAKATSSSSSKKASSSSAKPASSSSSKKASSSSAKVASSSSKKASSSSSKPVSSSSAIVVEAVGTEEDMPSCTAKRENMTYYITEMKTVFVCRNRVWIVFDPSSKLATTAPSAKFSALVDGRNLQISGAKVGSQVSLFDMQGRVIYNGHAGASNFSLNVIHSGSFLLRVGTQQQVVNIR